MTSGATARVAAHAARSTQSPIGTMRPDSSAMPRNSTGGTCSSPRHQRTRASTPVTREVASSTIGWNSTASRSSVTARCRSLVSSRRRTMSACMCAAKISTRPPPRLFARDIATSALRITSPAVLSPASATPTLAVSAMLRPDTLNGSAEMHLASCSARSTTSLAPARACTRIANSSSPQRASVC